MVWQTPTYPKIQLGPDYPNQTYACFFFKWTGCLWRGSTTVWRIQIYKRLSERVEPQKDMWIFTNNRHGSSQPRVHFGPPRPLDICCCVVHDNDMYRYIYIYAMFGMSTGQNCWPQRICLQENNNLVIGSFYWYAPVFTRIRVSTSTQKTFHARKCCVKQKHGICLSMAQVMHFNGLERFFRAKWGGSVTATSDVLSTRRPGRFRLWGLELFTSMAPTIFRFEFFWSPKS